MLEFKGVYSSGAFVRAISALPLHSSEDLLGTGNKYRNALFERLWHQVCIRAMSQYTSRGSLNTLMPDYVDWWINHQVLFIYRASASSHYSPYQPPFLVHPTSLLPSPHPLPALSHLPYSNLPKELQLKALTILQPLLPLPHTHTRTLLKPCTFKTCLSSSSRS